MRKELEGQPMPACARSSSLPPPEAIISLQDGLCVSVREGHLVIHCSTNIDESSSCFLDSIEKTAEHLRKMGVVFGFRERAYRGSDKLRIYALIVNMTHNDYPLLKIDA